MPVKVQEFLGGGSKLGVKSTCIVQGEHKGIAHAVNCAYEFTGNDPLVMYLGRQPTEKRYQGHPQDDGRREGRLRHIAHAVTEPQRYGDAELSKDGNMVLRCVRKAKETESNSAHRFEVD